MITDKLSYFHYRKWVMNISIIATVLCCIPILMSIAVYGLGLLHFVFFFFIQNSTSDKRIKNRILHGIMLPYYLFVNYVLFGILGYESPYFFKDSIFWDILLFFCSAERAFAFNRILILLYKS